MYGNQSDNSADYAGAAYAFTGLGQPRPQFALVRDGSSLQFSWPATATGFVLQSVTTLTNGGDWQDFPTPPSQINGQKVVTVTPTGPHGFFRLRGP